MFIHWMESYPVDSIIQCLNNWGQMSFRWDISDGIAKCFLKVSHPMHYFPSNDNLVSPRNNFSDSESLKKAN